MRTRLLFCAFLGAALLLQPSNALTQPPGKGRKSESPFVPKGNKASSAKAGDLKKYDDVITKDVKTQTGVFAVHRHDDKVYFEIPQDAFGQLILWQRRGRQGPGRQQLGRRGARQRRAQVRAPRQQDLPLEGRLRQARRRQGRSSRPSRPPAPTPSSPPSRSSAEGKDRSAVINMSRRRRRQLPGPVAHARRPAAAASIDMSRSYLNDVKAFPTNIEARAAADLPRRRRRRRHPRPARRACGGGARSMTAARPPQPGHAARDSR